MNPTQVIFKFVIIKQLFILWNQIFLTRVKGHLEEFLKSCSVIIAVITLFKLQLSQQLLSGHTHTPKSRVNKDCSITVNQ